MKGAMLSALALAGLGGSGMALQQAKVANTDAVTVQANSKATRERKSAKEKISVNDVTGGLDFNHGGEFGLTPKQYGQQFGNGGSKRSNRLRYSHNAKVKRRKAR